MYKKLLLITIFMFGLCLPKIKNVDSNFVSSVSVSNIYETETLLEFYFNDTKDAVGFYIYPISDYENIEYKIEYKRDGGLTEVIFSDVDNTSSNNEIRKQWFTLGTCSSGGTCIYHSVEGNIDITIKLYKNGFVEKTLTSGL